MLCCSESDLEGALDYLPSYSFEGTDLTANTLGTNERDVFDLGRPC